MRRLDFIRAILLAACGALAACAPAGSPPAPVITPAPAPEQIFVVVERGQTLDAIAKSYHVTKQEIIAANKLTPPYTVKPGRVLAIPVVAGEPPPEPKKPAPTKPKPTSAAADADEKPERAAPAPRPARPKRPPPEVVPLD